MSGKSNRGGQVPPVSPLGATAQLTKQQPRSKRHNTRWLYEDIDRQECLCTIAPAGLAPCDQAVTSEDEARLLGTFCWTSEKTVRVPSREPVFQPVPLPVVLPPAPNLRAAGRIVSKPSKNHRANTNKPSNNTMAPHILAPLAQAITTMSPSHRLRDTDLVVQRNSLRKLFALCAGRSHESFRIGLHLVNDTLVITKDDRFAWHPAITRAAGVGLSFEKTFTKPLPGREGDQAHHRIISYSLGDLRCVVQFEADACYLDKQGTAGEGEELAAEKLAIEEQLRFLSLGSSATLPTGDTSASTIPSEMMLNGVAAPQSTVAEMKSSKSDGKLAETTPQLWFGRTPWLIQGRREGNTVTAVKITRAAERFAAWEQRHQETLRRIVTLVRELRESVRAAGDGSRHCVLVYDQTAPGGGGGQQRVVRVYRSKQVKEPLPRDLVERLWGPD